MYGKPLLEQAVTDPNVTLDVNGFEAVLTVATRPVGFNDCFEHAEIEYFHGEPQSLYNARLARNVSLTSKGYSVPDEGFAKTHEVIADAKRHKGNASVPPASAEDLASKRTARADRHLTHASCRLGADTDIEISPISLLGVDCTNRGPGVGMYDPNCYWLPGSTEYPALRPGNIYTLRWKSTAPNPNVEIMIQETDGGWGFDSACAVLSPTAPCGNTCNSASDGACDDGGPGAEFSSCFFGTDCADCGPRSGMSSPPPPLCVNTCLYASSGWCNDGGFGSSFSDCALGTDCADCGSRPPAPPLCSNTCNYASDGDCDDGGPGAEFYSCNYGTDCSDCGPRTRIPNQAYSGSVATSPNYLTFQMPNLRELRCAQDFLGGYPEFQFRIRTEGDCHRGTSFTFRLLQDNQTNGYDTFSLDVPAEYEMGPYGNAGLNTGLRVKCVDCHIDGTGDVHVLLRTTDYNPFDETWTWGDLSSLTFAANVEVEAYFAGSLTHSRTVLDKACIPGLCLGGRIAGIQLYLGVFAELSLSAEVNYEVAAALAFERSVTLPNLRLAYHTRGAAILQDDVTVNASLISSGPDPTAPQIQLNIDATAKVSLIPRFFAGLFASISSVAQAEAYLRVEVIIALEAHFNFHTSLYWNPQEPFLPMVARNSIDGVDDQCTPSPPPPSFLCLDSCTYASDSSCDDGGPGSEFIFRCTFGTDCTDCGPRAPPGPNPWTGPQCCSNAMIGCSPTCSGNHDTCCGKLNYPLCGSVWFDLWSFVCACALMHAGCDSRNLCGFGIFCACSRLF